MKTRPDKKRRLSQKIVLIVSAVSLLTCMIIFVVYNSYYSRILREYAKKDGQTWAKQLQSDINDIYDEAYRFGKFMSIDEKLSGILTTDDYGSVVNEISEKRNAGRHLIQLESTAKYIDSIALVRKGTAAVWTRNQFFDELSAEVTNSWYDSILNAGGEKNDDGIIVTNPYTYTLNRKDYEEIAIRIPVYVSGEENSAEIVITISMDTLKDILDEYSEDFQTVSFVWEDEQRISTSDADTESGRNSLSFSLSTTLNGIVTGTYLTPPAFSLSRTDLLFPVLIFATILMLTMGILMPVMLHLTKPARMLVGTMEKAGSGDLTARACVKSGDEFEMLSDSLNSMIEKLDQYFNDSIQNEHERSELEFEVLAAQINPHFIYNTLNTVIYLTKKERPEDVIRITNALIDLLQDGVKLGGNRTYSTVCEECMIIDSYVIIQNYRYGGLVTVRKKVDESLETCIMPASVLQTIVENSIFHGIVAKGEPGTIDISVTENSGRIIVTVADDGAGMSQERIEEVLSGQAGLRDESRNHIGISNVINRLKILYGNEGSFDISSEIGKGTVITMTFPDRKQQI